MKIGRIKLNNNIQYGVLHNQIWYPQEISHNNKGIESFFFDFNPQLSEGLQLNEIENMIWLPPVHNPGKVLCIGRNYAEHSKEQNKDLEKSPLIFSKFSTSMAGHLNQIPFPPHSQYLDYEVELAVLIGKQATRLTEDDDVTDYIFGFTVANDLTARDVQKSEKQWTRGKGFDNSLPIGPIVKTKDEIDFPNQNEIWLTVNGEKRQLSNTSKMIFDIPFLIRYISQTITLGPSDILLTGTPEGVGYYMDPKQTLSPGDEVASGITDIGELRFTIAETY